MQNIDGDVLEQTIAKTFKEVKTAVDRHSERSIELYSLALRALVELRAQIIAEQRGGDNPAQPQ